MTHWRVFWKFALPSSISLMGWVTMRTVSSLGTESMVSYGFPVPWYAPDSSSSMSFDIASLPLLIDLLVYTAACELVMIWGMAPRLDRSRLTAAAMSTVLWLVAVASVAVTMSAIGWNPLVVAWTLSDYFVGATNVHGFQFGPGHWF